MLRNWFGKKSAPEDLSDKRKKSKKPEPTIAPHPPIPSSPIPITMCNQSIQLDNNYYSSSYSNTPSSYLSTHNEESNLNDFELVNYDHPSEEEPLSLNEFIHSCKDTLEKLSLFAKKNDEYKQNHVKKISYYIKEYDQLTITPGKN